MNGGRKHQTKATEAENSLLLVKIMDSRKANGISPNENGSQRRPSYSIETPYGFHLDLDFLKYVDDIEKGNTIRRVPMQRRQRGRNNGILSRNLSLPGYGCRTTQWNTLSTFWPKTQPFDFRSSDRRAEPIYTPLTTAEMDASIKAFDEQPLGCYVRPNLLRASSLPLTVLLRKHSESTEDPTSPKQYLAQRNGSSEDVFNASYSRTTGANGTLRRLTAALERVGELEAEIRVIPELKAQICILQEERERLLLQLHSQNDTTGPLDDPTVPLCALITKENKDQASDDWMNREYDRLEKDVKDAVVTPSVTRKTLPERSPQDGDKTKYLTETLQKKVVILEQDLHRLEVELDKSRDLLKQQVEESHLKDEKIKQLTIQHDTVAIPETNLVTTLNVEPVLKSCEAAIGEQAQETTATEDLRQPTVSHADMKCHVKQLQKLLQEQWECLCKDDISGKTSSEHLPPRVRTIQEQLVTLVTVLSLYVLPTGEPEPESKMKELVPVVESENLKRQSLKKISLGDRNAVNKDFMDACNFLNDHMDKLYEPDDETSKALTVVFQQWFHVSAEEDAQADIVALYLSEVNLQTPTVLPFLVNMVDDNGNTALHYSISHSNFSIVKHLLDTGLCKTNLRNKSGYTAFTLASMSAAESPEDLQAVQQLMELSDINSHVGQVGQTALHLAVRHGRVPIVRLLLAQGADPNAQDQAGTTPLISACDRGNASIVRILLEEAHCDVNLKDKGGRSALSLATQASHTEIADLLKARTETKSSDKCKVS
ncbi:KN motif and ankyrin repeat domain-containing protein 4 isoform X3 [Misgurnus anguillicaudatus]|uniref:KN motif and ankyrin repeat domain-containing protein 4 isoform X3 n=1 Tax=Misgurnus anguillicaudatus TaxID=75329 RepID=UPI003CCF0054